MKAAVWKDYHVVEVQEVPDPQISEHEVLIKVWAAGVCATDLEVISGRFIYGAPPHVLGHEIAGEIVQTGSAVTTRRVGERVVVETSVGCGHCEFCRRGDRHLCPEMTEIGFTPHWGGYAQYVKAPAENLFVIPDNISYDEAGILESTVCPVGGLMRLGVHFGETVLVYGVGPAGIAFIQGAKAMGAGRVIAVARSEERLRRAAGFGADYLICSKTEDVRAKVLEYTDGKGADLVCEAAGSPETILSACACARRSGRIILYGIPDRDKPLTLPYTDIIMNQLEMYGVVGNPHVWEPLLQLASSGRFNLRDMVTAAFPLDRIGDAMRLMEDSVHKPIKVVVHPWES
ncbi:MAG TPA: alcohol dehydrogenase catalytic domain-containing protein [Candidatus Caccousia stercoris]|uniref:Alcohol dehydrogenase catalytic domain-containing protein n=1 Tax=Candidatus Caccousia stercoris TaxID=2840723 RepID=A0A9D1K3L4_9FIRM|nr:alcohol dehydrogenase catalytic domain-containing protein [Candidatus Caccousia stercoris]